MTVLFYTVKIYYVHAFANYKTRERFYMHYVYNTANFIKHVSREKDLYLCVCMCVLGAPREILQNAKGKAARARNQKAALRTKRSDRIHFIHTIYIYIYKYQYKTYAEYQGLYA